MITGSTEEGIVISKYLTLNLEKHQLFCQNSSVAVDHRVSCMCNVDCINGVKPLRPECLFQKYFLKVKQLICKISVLISSEAQTMENQGLCQLIAVAVTPLRKGKNGIVDDVCHTCNHFI